VKLAAEADDLPMAGHVLRAMAHQAVDLGHFRQGLDLAAASMDGKRYLLASPRERAVRRRLRAGTWRGRAEVSRRRGADQSRRRPSLSDHWR
jgi:hypothetical protein